MVKQERSDIIEVSIEISKFLKKLPKQDFFGKLELSFQSGKLVSCKITHGAKVRNEIINRDLLQLIE